jgi:hypothetical protein
MHMDWTCVCGSASSADPERWQHCHACEEQHSGKAPQKRWWRPCIACEEQIRDAGSDDAHQGRAARANHRDDHTEVLNAQRDRGRGGDQPANDFEPVSAECGKAAGI